MSQQGFPITIPSWGDCPPSEGTMKKLRGRTDRGDKNFVGRGLWLTEIKYL